MKKILLTSLILILAVSLFGCSSTRSGTQPPKDIQQKGQQRSDDNNEKAVINLVGSFGKKLQNVSLLAPTDIVNKSMQENYGDFVTPELLKKWQSDLQNAPGRMVSSPWPDRIEILAIEKISENAYEVKGEIIEITSVEQVSGGIAAKRLITLLVKKLDSRWLIDDVALGAYEEAESIIYKNSDYGFDFSLPPSWKGYKLATDKWAGLALENSQGEKTVEAGPIIYIRHPQWTSENPRQDIPIMIFTLTQWASLQQEKFHIGAAPIGPSELGRNNKYVFALPARYNFAFPTGYEEVENILQSKPLHPINK